MYRRFLFCATFLITLPLYAVFAQESLRYSGAIIYLEYGGATSAGSINIEHSMVAGNEVVLDARIGFLVGIGTNLSDNDTYSGVHGGLHGFVNLPGSVHPEVGLDVSYIAGRQKWYIYESKTLFLLPSIGVRYQRPTGGVFFRALLVPNIILKQRGRIGWNSNDNIIFSLSLGHYFGRRND